ncbi:hypothetical protein PHLCEN_2v12188 [Hermanssonia centrifuga]|uniref:Uncharacterized protein n=1 Tax=Hermanssonia centrifuga TaxID=98765 RepID=A0A2R6NI93_9APHY|nr:hypothetical protein PHLCEN_2v12188 [Hermanssonia centrifuga]
MTVRRYPDIDDSVRENCTLKSRLKNLMSLLDSSFMSRALETETMASKRAIATLPGAN